MAEITFRRFQQLQLNPSVDNGKTIGLLFTISESEAPIGMAAPIEFLHEVYQRIPDLLAAAQQARVTAGAGTLAPFSTNVAGWHASECHVALEAEEVRLEYRLGEDCRATLRMPREMAERISAEMADLLGGAKGRRGPVAPPKPLARAASEPRAESAALRRNRRRSPERKTPSRTQRTSSGRAPAKRKARTM